MPIVIICSLPFIYLLIRKPVLRRLAVRNATRRPRETALVLIGSLLGTAIITGSLIVGDTLNSSIRRGAFTQLGPVDETIFSNGPADASQAEVAAGKVDQQNIDGVLPLTSVTVAAATTGTNPKAEPTAELWETDFARAATFGNDPSATGIDVALAPRPGEAAIGKDLARTLHLAKGQAVTIFAYGKRLDLKVNGVLPRLGVAGLHYGFGSTSPNLFVAPGTIGQLAAGAPPGAAPPTRLVAISNKGGVVPGAKLSPIVTRELQAATRGLHVQVKPSKADLLKNADDAGKQFTQLFQGIGMFGVLAGIMLLINIFVMLAQERKTEMGMLRAVGLRRNGLVGSFSLEGWLYGLASAALGTLAGIGVGRVIVYVAAGIFGKQGRFSLEIHYAARFASIQGGFAAGFMISLVTVLLTSIWVSRLNVIRAIRDLPEPENLRVRLLSQVVGGLFVVIGLVLLAAGVASDSGAPVLLGPAVAALGFYLVLRRTVRRRPLITATSVVALAWAVSAFTVVRAAFRSPAIPVFVVQGVVLTAAAVSLVTVNQDTIGGFIRRIGGGSKNMSLRLGLAYPLARRFRTGMILSMYSLVVFTLTFIIVVSSLFGNQLGDFTRKISGGYALRLDSNPSNPVTAAAIKARPEVSGLAPLSSVGAEFSAPRLSSDFTAFPATTFDASFVDQGPPALTKRGAFPDDAAAYRSVLQPSSHDIVVTRFFLQTGGGGPPKAGPQIGDPVTVRDPLSGRTATLTISAIAESGFGSLLALIPPHVMTDVFGDRAVADELYIATKPGIDNDAFATSLNGAFVANGADAKSFRNIVNENLSRQQQFFRLMQGYLALGLLVGIAGLGVVMVRAVRERRRQVGVLRALGFPAGAIRRAFIAESAFVALEGIVIGTGLALVTSWRLIGSGSFGDNLGFAVPWLQLAILIVATFVASMLATATPAQQASRIRPAVALRMTD